MCNIDLVAHLKGQQSASNERKEKQAAGAAGGADFARVLSEQLDKRVQASAQRPLETASLAQPPRRER